ncbi:MAG: DUF1343 domain-containing protein [Candidatus Marinimicrobia bacterium]|nr:DUF1343 domain-containing protein [Candidatus Neomarinimicrobiota bacterium]MDD5583251.1 DUF1343 domain-containing protein [Candidatus Neomarinimicrobiota bacterium]
MKKITTLMILFLFIAGCASTEKYAVKPGIEVLRERDFDLLKGKRVGLLTNPTGIDRELKSTIDILWEAPDVDLVALYAPEHGVRGDFDAGDYVENYIDEQTGLPVYSLYGKTRVPTPEMLEDIDVIVYDIQDIGCRSYTYISSMGNIMKVAAENDIEVVILDRPNPLTGNKIEGNVAEEGFFSFVSAYPIPYVYGLTPGELAWMINEEGWLETDKKCKLHVVPIEGWKRSMTFEETGLPWVPTSPHVPHAYSAAYYVATGILGELKIVNEGVGYTLPFQLFGAEWIDNPFELANRMNALGLDGVKFRPIFYKPFYRQDAGKTLKGVQVHITNFEKSPMMYVQFHFLEVLHEMYPEVEIFSLNPQRHSMFDKVCGTDEIRKKFSERYRFEDIQPILERDIESFKKLSQKYYLYQ